MKIPQLLIAAANPGSGKDALDPVPEAILKYVNRLSDYFFALARLELEQVGLPEEKWQVFTYKKKNE
ncbi:MAG: ATP:cob(I)alamin adenosyltransferase [Bacteroidales bacterium]|nr:ATP:cob(I)alamin adenosyltransferase [Bacteroidales bacterium]